MTVDSYDKSQIRPVLRWWVGHAAHLEQRLRDSQAETEALRELAGDLYDHLLRSLGRSGYPTAREQALASRYLELVARLEKVR